MVPLNPFRAETVIVEDAEVPTVTATGEVAAMLKSVTVNVAVAEWESEPLVPVTVRTWFPFAVALHETVAVPEPVTLVGVMAPQVNPAAGLAVRDTTPAKPF